MVEMAFLHAGSGQGSGLHSVGQVNRPGKCLGPRGWQVPSRQEALLTPPWTGDKVGLRTRREKRRPQLALVPICTTGSEGRQAAPPQHPPPRPAGKRLPGTRLPPGGSASQRHGWVATGQPLSSDSWASNLGGRGCPARTGICPETAAHKENEAHRETHQPPHRGHFHTAAGEGCGGHGGPRLQNLQPPHSRPRAPWETPPNELEVRAGPPGVLENGTPASASREEGALEQEL